jgi:hypothetical protein
MWLRGWQRRRPAGRRCAAQTPARPRSARRAGPGLAAHPVAVREGRGSFGPDPPRACPGRSGHRPALRAGAGPRRRITIDVDPTDAPTHGPQQFAFFNGHYDTSSDWPWLGFVTFTEEAEQYLLFALLRPGTSPAKLGLRGRLRILFRKLRAAFPGARLRVRRDGGFAGEDVRRFLEAEGVEYVVAIGGNRRLDKRARRLMGRARMLAKATGETAHLFGETRYGAKRWRRKRRASSRPKWCGIRGGIRRTTPGLW